MREAQIITYGGEGPELEKHLIEQIQQRISHLGPNERSSHTSSGTGLEGLLFSGVRSFAELEQSSADWHGGVHASAANKEGFGACSFDPITGAVRIWDE